MDDIELTRAVVAYLGKGRSPYPRTDEDAVTELAAGEDQSVLLARVRAVTADMMAISIDGTTMTLAEGGREAQRILAARHPELGRDALEALYWMFTYQSR